MALWDAQARDERLARTPDTAALAAAAAVVAAELQPGDRIAFLPVWAAQERAHFEAAVAAHGQNLAEAWSPSSPLTAWELDGVQRLWLLRAPPELAQQIDHLGTVELRRAFGDGPDGAGAGAPTVELSRLRPRPSDTALDLGRALDIAEVERVADGGKGPAERCRWDGARQHCAGEWWRSVGYGIHEAGHSRRRCVYATPHPDGAVLRLRWPKVPPAAALAGRIGNRLWAVRHEEGSDVLLRLRVGATLKLEQRLPRGDFDWHSLHAALTPAERGQPVELELSATDHRWRQLCFELRLVGATGAADPRRAEAATAAAGDSGVLAGDVTPALSPSAAATPTGASADRRP